MPAAIPIKMAGIGVTYPEAGVMHTNPATTPDAAPSTLGFPRVIHSIPDQASAPAAAAKCVAAKALAAMPSAAKCAARVKSEPTDPQHAGAQHGIGEIVRRHGIVPITKPLADQQSANQRRHAGADMHHGAAGKIQRPAANARTVYRTSACRLPKPNAPAAYKRWFPTAS